MDVAARGHDELARRLVERYVAASGDGGVPALMPYHVTQRALVRAKIAMIRRQALSAGQLLQREHGESELNRYLGLALDEHRRAAARMDLLSSTPHDGEVRLVH